MSGLCLFKENRLFINSKFIASPNWVFTEIDLEKKVLSMTKASEWDSLRGAGCSSVDSVPAFEAVGHRIDPSQWTQLQFGLFSVPTSGPQLVYQRPWYALFWKRPWFVLSCLWDGAYKRTLAVNR